MRSPTKRPIPPRNILLFIALMGISSVHLLFGVVVYLGDDIFPEALLIVRYMHRTFSGEEELEI